jgi:preprotein translocase subunit SecG
MQSVLVTIQMLVSIALVGCGGSGLGGLFSPRGAADTLTRTTAVLAALFFLSSLSLTILALHGKNESFLNSAPAKVLHIPTLPMTQPHPAAPQTPSVPSPH